MFLLLLFWFIWFQNFIFFCCFGRCSFIYWLSMSLKHDDGKNMLSPFNSSDRVPLLLPPHYTVCQIHLFSTVFLKLCSFLYIYQTQWHTIQIYCKYLGCFGTKNCNDNCCCCCRILPFYILLYFCMPKMKKNVSCRKNKPRTKFSFFWIHQSFSM